LGFGVAIINEAWELKLNLPGKLKRPVWVLGPAALPWERHAIVSEGFIPVVSDFDGARPFSEVAESVHKEARIQLAVDTGMGRAGCRPGEVVNLAKQIANLPGVAIESIGSHLPSADEDEAFTQDQLRRFRGIVRELRRAGVAFDHAHIANSAGTLGYATEDGESVRVGLMLYGCSPLPEQQTELRPVLSWKSRVCLVRELPVGHGVSYGRTFVTGRPTLAATISVGYADGFPRHLSGVGTEVLIRGRRCSLLGRVTMDQIIVDVTDMPELPVAGDEVVLIGNQDSESISVDELAGRAGTIPWEIFTGIGRRVHRVYY